jgi:hypothetical protein
MPSLSPLYAIDIIISSSEPPDARVPALLMLPALPARRLLAARHARRAPRARRQMLAMLFFREPVPSNPHEAPRRHHLSSHPGYDFSMLTAAFC